MADEVADAVRTIREAWAETPRAAIILGTGLGGLATHVEQSVIFSGEDLPALPRPTAVAHEGRLVCGRLAGVPVVAVQGRVHYYEGFEFAQITLPLRIAAQLGCQLLIVSNASGGLNPNFHSGDIMAIEDHLDWMGDRNATLRDTSQSPAQTTPRGLMRPGNTSYYDRELIDIAVATARRESFECQRGVYAAVTGPNYETRAEYRFLRRVGADVVGMSTIPEVVAARRSGLRVLALSAVTNVARPDARDKVDAMDVVDIAEHAEPKLRAIVRNVLQSL